MSAHSFNFYFKFAFEFFKAWKSMESSQCIFPVYTYIIWTTCALKFKIKCKFRIVTSLSLWWTCTGLHLDRILLKPISRIMFILFYEIFKFQQSDIPYVSKNIIQIYHVEFSFWIFSSAIIHINRISNNYPQILSIQGRSLNFSRGASFSQKHIYPPNVIQSLSILKL